MKPSTEESEREVNRAGSGGAGGAPDHGGGQARRSENADTIVERERWGRLGVREEREVIARVLASVLVLPVPEGVSDRAPFDPTLLIPSWCREKAVRLSGP
ncbi:hypothetical protein GCM10010230_21210 [Streptomyces narbonensis]|nr:hypothetical protein GCM10010230_21210 [Streptomyces narbonensis]